MEAGVVVIGAGPAGLSAAAELKRAGVPVVVLERADAVAASWRGRYDVLRLNTARGASQLPGGRFPRGTPALPTRDQVIAYFDGYARDKGLDVRLNTTAERIDRAEDGSGFVVQTSTGPIDASHVIVATGFEHTPKIPDWAGRERFGGRLLHAHDYRNPAPFAGADALVVGPGCSGMEIAYDLAENGAARVRLAVRTPPNIMLKSAPGDRVASVLLKVPVGLADGAAGFVRRMSVGKLDDHGLPVPEVGIFARTRVDGKAPAIVDKEVIDAIKAGKIEVVAGVESLDETGVTLADGSRIEPDVVIAATGYTRGLDALVGHLDVLDERGTPRIHRGDEAAPGLRFIGYFPRPSFIGSIGREGRKAARAIAAAG